MSAAFRAQDRSGCSHLQINGSSHAFQLERDKGNSCTATGGSETGRDTRLPSGGTRSVATSLDTQSAQSEPAGCRIGSGAEDHHLGRRHGVRRAGAASPQGPSARSSFARSVHRLPSGWNARAQASRWRARDQDPWPDDHGAPTYRRARHALRHADRNELLRWCRGFPRPPRRCFVVHGEPAAADALRHVLEHELGWPDVRVPLYGEKTEIGVRRAFRLPLSPVRPCRVAAPGATVSQWWPRLFPVKHAAETPIMFRGTQPCHARPVRRQWQGRGW